MVDFCFRNVIAAKKGPQKCQFRYNQKIHIIVPVGHTTTYLIDITLLAIILRYRIIYNVDENAKRWIT